MLDRLKAIPLPELKVPPWMTHAWLALRARLAPVAQRFAPAWNSGRAWYEKREPREKVLLTCLSAIVGVLLLYNVIYEPIIELRQDLADRVEARRHDLVAVRGMMVTYARLSHELAATEKLTVPRGHDFSLFSLLEQTLTSAVGHAKIGSLTPSDHPVPGGLTQYTVAVKLTEVSLAQVVDALYGIEQISVPVTISNLQVQEHTPDSHSYDVDLTCMAVSRNG